MVNIQANNAYYLTNAKGGTCMDLSGGDNVSIIGFEYHSGPNQSWVFQDAGQSQTFNIKSAGSNKYLSYVGEPHDGLQVVGADSPFAWRIEDEHGVDNGVRVFPANNANFCVDLSDYGNSRPGTPVEMWGCWEGLNQVWKLQKV